MPSVSIAENSEQVYDVASHGDFHVFSFKEKFFLYDVFNMNAYEINEKLYFKLAQNREDSEFFKSLLSTLQINQKNRAVGKKSYNHGVGTISLNVAQVCNLSCVYCYGVDGEYGTKGKMNEPTAYKSVDFLISESKSPNISIHFFGGEPLLNFPLMKKVVDYSLKQAELKGKRIEFSITTNGTKFSKEVNNFLNTHDFNVIVSFDGDESMQDKNRPFKNGGGSYSVIKPKIEEFLKSRNGNATARATVTNHSYDLKALRGQLKKMGFNTAGATVATLSEFATENRPVDHLSKEQKINLLLESDNETEEILNGIKNRDLTVLSDLSDSTVLIHVQELKHKQKKFFPCGVGRGLLAISITGDIYPCHRFVGDDKFKMGHIDTYDGTSANQYAQSHTQTHPVCSKCWAKYHCGGLGCIHDNYITKGAIDNINTDHCTSLKNDLKNAIYIFSSLTKADREFLSPKRKNI